MQDFIVNLYELLKNGQLVDKMFAFCPIDPDGTDKKIHEVSGIQTNMTILGAHFKILSNGKNPFEKQKQWKKNKKDKEEFRDPIVYFLLQWLWTKTSKISSHKSFTSGSVVVVFYYRSRNFNLLKVIQS